ncbi:hypothetical protein D9619_000562 [Psilocybe cf. subviscida]|uniref:Uncharacterized protein n=1 Tax=Psilocybe cf. subviscida TaxID=2480587 RepID=A0A8H5BH08_9AGAR|nr:hypothetical protein D9619_000562 [Psilocybe cf. subviscida]
MQASNLLLPGPSLEYWWWIWNGAPMQGHPTGKNNPCRPTPVNLFQPSPTKPWPRTNQVIGRMMDSFRSGETGDDIEADNELEDFDTSYECPSASSSSSDESATSTSTLVNPNKRRPVPCTPPPSKRAGTSLPRSRRSLSTDISIELIPPASHFSSDRSFFLESPFHHTSNAYPYPAYPPDPIPTEPPFVIPDTGVWNRVNPNHKHPANNVQLVGLPLTSSTSSLQREGSARPTEFVPSPERLPVIRRTRRPAVSNVPDAPGVQMLQPPPSHPEKFWGTECPTERAGSESRVSTPTPAFSTLPLRARSGVSMSVSGFASSRTQYLEVPPRNLPCFRTAPPEEEEMPSRSAYDEDDGESSLAVPATISAPVSRLPTAPPEHTHIPLDRSFEVRFALASRDIIKMLLREFLGSLRTLRGFMNATLYGFIPLFCTVLAAQLAASWVKENWLS